MRLASRAIFLILYVPFMAVCVLLSMLRAVREDKAYAKRGITECLEDYKRDEKTQ